MAIITLAEVKTLTGITGTDQDAAITAILPYLEAKVKEITGRKWAKRVTIETTLGDTEAAVEPIDYDDAYTTEPYNGNVGNRRPLDLLHEFIEVGAKISGAMRDDGVRIVNLNPDSAWVWYDVATTPDEYYSERSIYRPGGV